MYSILNISVGVGADILDSTNQNVFTFGTLEEEDTWFELSQEQRVYFDNMRYINSYLREEFHAIHDLLWKTGETNLYGRLPKRLDILNFIEKKLEATFKIT